MNNPSINKAETEARRFLRAIKEYKDHDEQAKEKPSYWLWGTWLVAHREDVRHVYDQAGGYKAAWDLMTKIRPDVTAVMKVESFRQYSRVMLALLDALGDLDGAADLEAARAEIQTLKEDLAAVRHELDKGDAEKTALLAALNETKAELNRVINRPDATPPGQQVFLVDGKPIKKEETWRVRGWNIERGKDGYLRAYRKIEGKVHCVYIGRTAIRAEQKIMDKERTLGLL